MKREELEALGLTKEQIDKLLNAHHKELDPVQKELESVKGDLENARKTVTTQKTTIADLKKDLGEFKDADVAGMKKKIDDLEKDIQTKESEYAQQIADRDFQDILKDAISAAKGKNAKAITALLDLDVLKESKNQKEDVAAALKTLAEAEDSKMLFGDPEPLNIGTGNPIGTVTKSGDQSGDAAMRAAMGLPPVPPATEQK